MRYLKDYLTHCAKRDIIVRLTRRYKMKVQIFDKDKEVTPVLNLELRNTSTGVTLAAIGKYGGNIQTIVQITNDGTLRKYKLCQDFVDEYGIRLNSKGYIKSMLVT